MVQHEEDVASRRERFRQDVQEPGDGIADPLRLISDCFYFFVERGSEGLDKSIKMSYQGRSETFGLAETSDESL